MMNNIKTFQETEERLKENAGAGLNKVVCIVLVLVLIVLVCVGGFYWYKHSKNKILNPLEQSGEKIESGEIEGSLSVKELVAMGLQVGDCVSYTTDINTSANWRVWKIEGDNIIIVPTKPLGDLTLGGAEDWLNAEEKIENECDKYINESLGIVAENIRSMKIEDIEEVLPEEEIEREKLGNYGKEYSYESGTFYVEKAEQIQDTFDGYNKELNTPKTATSNSPVKVVSTICWDNFMWGDIFSWNKLENTKIGMTNNTYAHILGYDKYDENPDNTNWLASRCVGCDSSSASFCVHSVSSGGVSDSSLFNSDGNMGSSSYGVRPLVSISSKLFTGEGEGTWSNSWKLGKKIENEEIEGTNGATGGNSTDNELELMGLQEGDYVLYTSDINTSANWRIWKIEGDNIIIVPTEPLGDLTLEGAKDWLNAEEKIENECDKYINSSLGITAENIRSMKIKDIEEVLPEEYVKSVKIEEDYKKEGIYMEGEYYAEVAGDNEKTFDGYNKELSIPKIAKWNSSVKLVNTYWHNISDEIFLIWNKLKNTKIGMNNDTYGTILGEKNGWLASRCVSYNSLDFNLFLVRNVSNGVVDGTWLCDSSGGNNDSHLGVRPLVFLSSKLFNGEGEGTESDPWQLIENL